MAFIEEEDIVSHRTSCFAGTARLHWEQRCALVGPNVEQGGRENNTRHGGFTSEASTKLAGMSLL